MAQVRTSAVSAGSLIGGYAVARQTHVRPLGGLVLAVGGGVCARQWSRRGPGRTAGLLVAFLAAFGLSHPLAKKIGAWPAVLSVSAATAVLAHALGDRSPAPPG
jgi:hypothetical protein